LPFDEVTDLVNKGFVFRLERYQAQAVLAVLEATDKSKASIGVAKQDRNTNKDTKVT
jgi:hypothetical protein